MGGGYFQDVKIPKILGFKEVKFDTRCLKEVKRRKLRTSDIRPLTDSRGPLLPKSYFTRHIINHTPEKQERRNYFYANFQNFKILDFEEAKCGSSGFNEVKQRNLRARPYGIYAVLAADFPDVPFYMSTQKCLSCEFGAQKLFPEFQNFGF